MLERKTAPAAERLRKTMDGSRFELKADEEGVFIALVYLCDGTADLDGDLIAPSAFKPGDVCVVSQWGHSAFGSELPAGMGAVRVDGKRITVSGRFFIETTHGRDTYETIKQLGARTEWSIGYQVLNQRAPTPEEMDRGIDRVILALQVFEVSPVNKGAAGDGRSGTVSIKSTLDDGVRDEMLAIRTKMRATHGDWPALKALALKTEVKRHAVPVAVRQAAERGAKMAAKVLLYDANAAAPTLRWLSDECARAGKMLGCVFGSVPREAWIKASLDARWAFDTAAHEVYHLLRPHGDEQDTIRFGKLLEAIDRAGLDVELGDPETITNSFGYHGEAVLVTRDLRVFEPADGYEWRELGLLS